MDFWKVKRSGPAAPENWLGKWIIPELGPRLLELRSKPRLSMSFPTLAGRRLQGKWNQQREAPAQGEEGRREPPYL